VESIAVGGAMTNKGVEQVKPVEWNQKLAWKKKGLSSKQATSLGM